MQVVIQTLLWWHSHYMGLKNVCKIYFIIAFSLTTFFFDKLSLIPQQPLCSVLHFGVAQRGWLPCSGWKSPGQMGAFGGARYDLQCSSSWREVLSAAPAVQYSHSRSLLRHSQYPEYFHFDLNEQLINRGICFYYDLQFE